MKKYFLLFNLIILSSCNKVVKLDGTSSKNHKPTEKEVNVSTTNNKKYPSRSKKNIILESKFDINLLFGIWTVDPEGPHADFELNKESFFVVDYDGDGSMLYKIHKDTLTVYFKDFTSIGLIKNVTKDSLTINWDENGITNYVKWKN